MEENVTSSKMKTVIDKVNEKCVSVLKLKSYLTSEVVFHRSLLDDEHQEILCE